MNSACSLFCYEANAGCIADDGQAAFASVLLDVLKLYLFECVRDSRFITIIVAYKYIIMNVL